MSSIWASNLSFSSNVIPKNLNSFLYWISSFLSHNLGVFLLMLLVWKLRQNVFSELSPTEFFKTVDDVLKMIG